MKPRENTEIPTRKPSGKKPTRGTLFLLRLNLFLSFGTLILFYSCTIRPEKFWIAGFAGFLILPALIVQFSFLFFWLYRRPFFALFSGLTLLLGIRFIQSTLGIHVLQTEACGNLKILSLNAKTFGGMDKEKQGPNEVCSQMVKQILESKADVICLQEMFDNPRSDVFNVVQKLRKGGYRYIYFSRTVTMRWGASVGMAICSRYPILDKTAIRKKTGSNNQIIRAEIEVEGKRIVIINMHLQSIFLKEQDLNTTAIKENFLTRISGIAQKMKTAYQARTKQIDLLLANTLDEDLPVIVCGDMNDTPYSNAYLRLRDSFQNAFEEKGRGFGITYNGKLPFLRIDHQFANDKLTITRFSVNRTFSGTDHFGTEACYQLNEEK